MSNDSIQMVLSCLMIFAIIPPVSDRPFEMAKLDEPATLPCSWNCSGCVKWFLPQNRSDVLAQCNRTKCQSKEGYKISHDQYLEGNLSLTITAADYSKRSKWYTCECDGTQICKKNLRIEPVEFIRQLKPGDSLIMDLPIPERVKVTFNRTDGGSQSSVKIYETSERKVQYHREYENRASSLFILKDLKESDGGVYTVWDTDNDEIISTYTLTLTGKKTDANACLPLQAGEQNWIWSNRIMEQYPGLLIGFFGGFLLCTLMGCFVVPRILRIFNRLWKRTKHPGSDDSTAEGKCDPERIQMNPVGSDKGSDG